MPTFDIKIAGQIKVDTQRVTICFSIADINAQGENGIEGMMVGDFIVRTTHFSGSLFDSPNLMLERVDTFRRQSKEVIFIERQDRLDAVDSQKSRPSVVKENKCSSVAIRAQRDSSSSQ